MMIIIATIARDSNSTFFVEAALELRFKTSLVRVEVEARLRCLWTIAPPAEGHTKLVVKKLRTPD